MNKYIAPIIGLAMASAAGTAFAATGMAETATQLVISIPTVSNFLGGLSGWVWEWLPKIVAGAAALAVYTKNDFDNKAVAVVLKIVNMLAFNFGAARNDPAVDGKPQKPVQ